MSSKFTILFVEDNLLVGNIVKEQLEEAGYEVVHVTTGADAATALEEQVFHVALCDLQLPDTTGQELMTGWRENFPDMMVIIMTAYGDITTAVECIKNGAHDFLTKPIEEVLLKQSVHNAVEQYKLGREVTILRQLRKRETPVEEAVIELDGIIATGDTMQETTELVQLVTESDFSCLFIRGESGTGKGLFARTIHQMGTRSEHPFVEINCSALPATLVESELFGHKKGAFTDAKENKVGLFELADKGTLFLDELGDMEVGLQAKLLKVIEDQCFRRIGDTKDIKVDVTIIAATHQEVEKLIEDGKFRQDLYYRLNVIPLMLPPLREHKEDITSLCEHFVTIYAQKFGKEITGFTDEAMEQMMNYEWPGNVRELRNVVERGCLLTREEKISGRQLLFPTVPGSSSTASVEVSIDDIPVMSLADAEKLAIERAMKSASGNKNEAARVLGLHRTTLYKKLEEYDLND